MIAFTGIIVSMLFMLIGCITGRESILIANGFFLIMNTMFFLDYRRKG